MIQVDPVPLGGTYDPKIHGSSSQLEAYGVPASSSQVPHSNGYRREDFARDEVYGYPGSNGYGAYGADNEIRENARISGYAANGGYDIDAARAAWTPTGQSATYGGQPWSTQRPPA
jgi:hypothetical protein